MKLWHGIVIIIVLSGAYLFADYLALFERGIEEEPASQAPVTFRIEEIARGLEVPWSIVWTAPERMLVAERPGRIRVIEKGSLDPRPLYTMPDVSTGHESGLMGLAVSPAYERDRALYASYTYARGSDIFVKVVRLRDEGERLVFDRTVFDGIPAASNHAGSRIAFGPDGMLYVTTGDALERSLAQDPASLAGKTLRLTREGGIPADNPFPGSPVWSLGHRNAQGIAWHPDTGVMYQSEHGPSVFDGPAGGDEINRVIAGGNYGWPLVSHEETRGGLLAPIALFTPAEAPAALIAYSGALFPHYAGDLFVGALRGSGLLRVRLTEDGAGVVSTEKLLTEYGRIRAVAEGPDGAIYVSTSNRDGRGEVRAGDDRILRLVPDEDVVR